MDVNIGWFLSAFVIIGFAFMVAWVHIWKLEARVDALEMRAEQPTERGHE
jgi:hypothetical protein